MGRARPSTLKLVDSGKGSSGCVGERACDASLTDLFAANERTVKGGEAREPSSLPGGARRIRVLVLLNFREDAALSKADHARRAHVGRETGSQVVDPALDAIRERRLFPLRQRRGRIS